MARPPIATGRITRTVESTQVLGMQGTLKNLRAIDEELRKEIIKAGSVAAAAIFLHAIRQSTYGPGRQRRTGLMLAAQGITASTKNPDTVLAGVVMKSVNVAADTEVARAVRSARSIAVGDTERRYMPFYWWFLERGTGERKQRRTGKRTGSITARPWVGPAFEAKGDTAIEAFRLTVSRMLDKFCATLPPTV